jgi:hypothetical protein
MIATIYIIAFILAVLFITYPKDFPSLITNPEALMQAIGVETKRRWMIVKFGTILWFEKKKMAYSLWRMKPIIEAERAKQRAQEENNID